MPNNSLHYLILGFGITGQAVLKFLVESHTQDLHQISFTVFDQNSNNKNSLDSHKNLNKKLNIEFIADLNNLSQKHKNRHIDLAIASPGIKPSIYKDILVKKLKIRVISDIQLFIDYLSNINSSLSTNLSQFDVKRGCERTRDRFKIFGITGTNGKSTVCALLDFLLKGNKQAHEQVYLGGNYGVAVTDLLDSIQNTQNITNYILELSSYQLELTDNLPCLASACLNITPDHLDWHKSMDNYINAKLKIFTNSNSHIINYDDNLLLENYKSKILSNGFKSNNLKLCLYSNKYNYQQLFESINQSQEYKDFFSLNNSELKVLGINSVGLILITTENQNSNKAICVNNKAIIRLSELPQSLHTEHNIGNLKAVIGLLAAKYYDLTSSNSKSKLISNLDLITYLKQYLNNISKFTNLPYRCELITDKNNIKIYNDSKATNLSATISSINSISSVTDGKVWLILGGLVKEDILDNNIISEFNKSICNNCHKISKVYINSLDSQSKAEFCKLLDSLSLNNKLEYEIIDKFSNLADYIQQVSKSGDSVLFSPGGASFDQFKNYIHRGEEFSKLWEVKD